ncbi:MAG: MBL fold metallo-hydrolase [Alphaproteobacteria bacterium]|nr:MBL fold metallo-hydrolase [Alphaproteobacteria bacterium]
MSIQLSFHGAARTVTGSCYLLQTDQARVLIDCGMFQGSKTMSELNYRPFPFEPASLDAMLLTHAHIDHTGVIPKLTKHGFKGKIHCTPGTVELCQIMLPDSGFIQETEVKNLNERNQRRGIPEVEPIYTLEDAMAALEHFSAVPYETWVTPAKGIRARYWNAGHLLGSASIEVEVEQPGKTAMRILFSGDIGPDNKLLEHDPEGPTTWDYVICESTYGGKDRFERSLEKRREILAGEMKEAASRGGVLLIPSFAVERTQEVVTDLVYLMDHKLAPQANIFIDSPLANKATAIFRKHASEMENGDDLAKAFNSPLVKSTESVEESKALNRFTGFYIVLAASGMAEAGRIRHHLKNHLWQKSTTVLFVGFQAEGSLGAILQAGAKRVKIMGEEINVAATIRNVEDYSGHADGPELEAWIKKRLPISKTLFLTHGEEERQIALEDAVKGKVVAADRILRPALDETYDLSGDKADLVRGTVAPRIEHAAVAKLDWHNDAQTVVLDLHDALSKAATDKDRAVILRRIKQAIAQPDSTLPSVATQRRRPYRARGFDEG